MQIPVLEEPELLNSAGLVLPPEKELLQLHQQSILTGLYPHVIS